MGRTFNANVVPDTQSDALPKGMMLVKFRGGTEEHAGDDNILCYNLRFDVLAPEAVAGLTWFHRAFVGTREDPEAEQDATVRKARGLRLIKRLCSLAGVNFNQDIDVVFEELRDFECVGRNMPRESNGTTYSDMKWVYAKGEAEPDIEDVRSTTGTTTPATPTNGETSFAGFRGTAIDE